MIPQTIHYCWFGQNPKPDLVLECIESWRKYMPDWDIIEWNETNYDVAKCIYAQEAYEAQKWAFVSDYARFDVLKAHGGIYVDTDVEFLQSIPESILVAKAFTGIESGGMVSPGLIFGTEPELPLILEILDSYEGLHFDGAGSSKPQTVNQRVTRILELHGFVRQDTQQRVADVDIYPAEYFCGYDQDVHEPRVTKNTISMHHYAHSWGGSSDRVRTFLRRTLRRGVGDHAYRSLLTLKRRLFGVRGA